MTFPSKKIYLVAAAFFLGLAIFTGLVILPLTRQIKIDSDQLFQKKQAVDSFYQGWQNTESSKKDYKNVSQALSDTSTLLAEPDAIKFILEVEKFAQATKNQENIAVVSLSPGDANASTVKSNALNFQISLTGSFPNLIKFLVYLENAPYYNDISSLQINSAGAKTTAQPSAASNLPTGEITSIINLSVYQPDATTIK